MSGARYEALARIGTGGMATVWLGRARGALGFERFVALKRAHPHVRDDPELRESLRLEATLAGRLRHPNVVSVLDVHEADGEIELVLDYVEGATLAELLAREVTDLRAVVRVLLDAAAGLEAVHRAKGDDGAPLGVVHRDVTPSNVLVGVDGVARIADFGIARTSEREGAKTSTGVLKGKVGYMAPEYVESYRANAASDQFSLGVVVWEALAAQRLFKGPTELETMKRVVVARVPDLGEARPELSPFDPVVRRALARDPAERYPSVGAFARAIEETARDRGLLGTHDDVARLVEASVGPSLASRREGLSSGTMTAHAAPHAPTSRDDVATASVVVPPSRSERGAPLASPGRATDEPPATPTTSPWSRRVAFGLGALAVAGVGAALFAASRDPRVELPETAPALASTPPATHATPSTTAASLAPVPSEPSTKPLTESPTASPSTSPTTKKTGSRPAPAHVPTKAPPNPYKPGK
ncbi:MAG: protein kinase [Polyangiaceae bacterium]